MNESNINHQNIGAALDAVKERHSRGELVGDRSISLTSALRQKQPDLRELNKKHSASVIASALTQEGFKVSASTIQRVLQESTGTKRKPRTAKVSDNENMQTTELVKSAPIPSSTATACATCALPTSFLFIHPFGVKGMLWRSGPKVSHDRTISLRR